MSVAMGGAVLTIIRPVRDEMSVEQINIIRYRHGVPTGTEGIRWGSVATNLVSLRAVAFIIEPGWFFYISKRSMLSLQNQAAIPLELNAVKVLEHHPVASAWRRKWGGLH